jgi:thiosulfate/3-mercaptopyruvate sulfurtransferase
MRSFWRSFGPAALGIVAVWLTAFSAGSQVLPSRLVSPDWLASHYGRVDIRIVDMRPDIRDYWASHLPGAIYLHPEALRWPEDGVPARLLPVEALTSLLGRMGIGPSTPVVVYSEKNGFMPLYLLWALDYLGHKECALLDGGFDQWKFEGRFLTQDYPVKIQAVDYPVPDKLRLGVRATAEEVRRSLGTKTVLVDSRAPEAYTGAKGTWKRHGHLPGAVNRFWNLDLAAGGGWKSAARLRAEYSALGVTRDKTVIVYCGSGQMSSHTYFVLKYILGFPAVKNYDGGFEEWANDPEMPIEESGRGNR